MIPIGLQTLREKTSESVAYESTSEKQAEFDRLKEKLTTALVTIYPDYSILFVVSTGTSISAIGAVLLQKDENE